jgi:hypothetical protein
LCIDASSGPESLRIFEDEAVILPASNEDDELLDETILITCLMRSFVSIGRKLICLERVEREKNCKTVGSWRDLLMDQFVELLEFALF